MGALVALHAQVTPESLQLELFGTLHEGNDTIYLLGPHEPGFWAHFTASAEYLDGAADPLDRWSKRAIAQLAEAWGGEAIFPSDGPPYPPFIAWALASGRAWQSPLGLLVHDRAGLMVSYRGAVRVRGTEKLPPEGTNPCETCVDQPCLTTCPVDALGGNGYDVQLCKDALAGTASDCMAQGCAARRACPQSSRYGRMPAQSAFHMRAFNPS